MNKDIKLKNSINKQLRNEEVIITDNTYSGVKISNDKATVATE